MATINKCKNDLKSENVIIIDLDNESFSDVNINIPKTPAKKPRGSKGLKNGKNIPLKAYIYIDDDDDVESPGNDIPLKDFPPVKLSKSKRMYPGRGLTSNGLNIHLDDDGETVIHDKEGQCTDAMVESRNKVVFTSSNADNSPIDDTIVDKREMIKDTAEYKQAQEEEMSARQLALKLQAEETQQQRRLLKRKKAEKLRLLDIKKRQKQRVEEIRESQKQDEENMNRREMYRIEVQQELKKLEMTCHDMASLLCGLGIFANSQYTTSQQVHTAYKRALLSFHPDRASGFDTRQQVEAEEKFKLISRMKDKVNKIPSLK